MQRYRKLLIISTVVIIAAVLVCVAFLATRTPVASVTTKPSPAIQTPPTRVELLSLVNAERMKNGVAPLTENPLLDQSAQWKAVDEVTFDYFGHVKPGTTGNNGLDYLNTIDKQCVYVAENLQGNPPNDNNSQAAFTAWVNSKPHHAAMIDPKYTLTGFGIDENEIVEHFCQVK